jgi:hypothetical protein
MSRVVSYVFDSMFERKDQVSTKEKLVVVSVLLVLTAATISVFIFV